METPQARSPAAANRLATCSATPLWRPRARLIRTIRSLWANIPLSAGACFGVEKGPCLRVIGVQKGPLLIENAQKVEAERVPSSAVYQAMYDAELFAMLAPRRYGGFEIHPSQCMRVWEAVAHIDASAAWNLVMNQGIANYAAWLPEAGVKELFAAGIPTIAGALHPPARARRVEGRWRVTGQVPFGRGCHCAQWLAMPAQEANKDVLFAVFFPRQSDTILDTWHTMGMRSTGSTDYRADDLFVPDHLVAPERRT